MTEGLTLWVALISVVGIVVGAGLQYVFTRVLEKRRHNRELRTQAYVDYVRGVSEVRYLVVQPLDGEEREILARLTDAKVRVCLYGSKDVTQKLAEFERLGGRVDTDTQQDAFVNILIAMRGSADAKAQDLEAIILGPRK